MKNITTKIESLKKQLKDLKNQHQLSYESVKKERGRGYNSSLTDTSLQVLCLLKGEIYKPYSWGGWCSQFNINQASKWEENGFVYYKYCYIYSKHLGGSPIGIVAPKEELFRAIGEYTFNDIWRHRVKNNSCELRGFNEFCQVVKKDHNFLLECVTDYYKIDYQVYKNRTLKIPELYIIMFNKNF